MKINKNIINWKCNNCNENIVFLDKNKEIIIQNHFDINISFYNIEFKENLGNRNEKMLYFLCEKCFLQMLNESPKNSILRKLFYLKENNMFIY